MVPSFVRRWFTRSPSPIAETIKNPPGASDAEAQFQRGLKCASGEGVAQDYVQAARWYAQAAEQNHALAQFNLAMLYSLGQGVSRDEAQSLVWVTRAAKLGDAAAQYKLGVQQHLACRENRRGKVSGARIEALKWVRLSAAQGYRGAASACEFVALPMTREEVAEGGRRVAAFVAG